MRVSLIDTDRAQAGAGRRRAIVTTGATSTLATYWRVLWSLQRTHFNRSLTYRLEWLFGIVSTATRC